MSRPQGVRPEESPHHGGDSVVVVATTTTTTAEGPSATTGPPPSAAAPPPPPPPDVALQPSATPTSHMVCYAIRLQPGEELKGALAAFTSDNDIRAGFILSCVGSVRDLSLRLAGAERPSAPSPSATTTAALDAPTAEEQQPMLHAGPDARFELLSLVGTLSPDGAHLHASLGDEEGAVCGGHLVRATVHTTAEIIIGVATSLTFSREMDPGTGFKELVVSARGAMTAGKEEGNAFLWKSLRCAVPVVMGTGVVVLLCSSCCRLRAKLNSR